MKLRNKKTGEPKDFQYIMADGNIDSQPDNNSIFSNNLKEIGNYFNTLEEAEEAVEKLKALKRLKCKGFKFNDFEYSELCDYARVNIKATVINDSIHDDLMLLFGGE